MVYFVFGLEGLTFAVLLHEMDISFDIRPGEGTAITSVVNKDTDGCHFLDCLLQ